VWQRGLVGQQGQEILTKSEWKQPTKSVWDAGQFRSGTRVFKITGRVRKHRFGGDPRANKFQFMDHEIGEEQENEIGEEQF
jgi:hypothetical protein